MSSFGAKNILRKDIVTHDVFFNNSAEIVDYLSSINHHYYYTTVPVKDLVKTPHGDHSPLEITGCMKQHLTLFKPKKEQFCTEYLCDCASCLQFHFDDCINKAVSSEKTLKLMPTPKRSTFLMKKQTNQSKFLILSPCCHLFL